VSADNSVITIPTQYSPKFPRLVVMVDVWFSRDVFESSETNRTGEVLVSQQTFIVIWRNAVSSFEVVLTLFL
jgi:hypothetical protein